MTTKRCPRCGLVRSVADFPPRKDRSSGVMSRCKFCDAAKAATYRAANLDRERARQREYQRSRYAAAQAQRQQNQPQRVRRRR
jgi:hypothetical protein